MNRFHYKTFNLFLFLFVALPLAFSACTDDETDLGISLTDPLTQFDGQIDTFYADRAWSRKEDSMLTVNFTRGVIGNLNDPIFGKTTSVFYTQVALPSSSFYLTGTIEKVTLTFAKEQLFPDSAHTYSFRFQVHRLAEVFPADTLIYNNRELAVDNTVYLDSTLTVGPTDTLVTLTLKPSFHSIIPASATAEEFLAQVRGLRVRITSDSENGMLGINLSSPQTCMKIYYHDSETGLASTYTMLMGAGAEHYTLFTHDYSGTPFAATDSLGGENLLYIGPLSGPYAELDFGTQLRAFASAHPLATIHYAELHLPVAATAPAQRPCLLQVRRNLNGTYVPARDMMPVSSSLESLLSLNPNEVIISGLVEKYLLKAYDGYYSNTDGGRYRMRLPQQLQQMLRTGNGQLRLVIDARYFDSRATVLNGINQTDKPKLVFVYSE